MKHNKNSIDRNRRYKLAYDLRKMNCHCRSGEKTIYLPVNYERKAQIDWRIAELRTKFNFEVQLEIPQFQKQQELHCNKNR